MTTDRDYKIQFPTMFGTITSGVSSGVVPDFSSYASAPNGYNPFGVTSPMFYSQEFMFKTPENTDSSNSSSVNSGWFSGIAMPQFNIPKFQMPIFSYTFSTPSSCGIGDSFTRNYSGTMSQQLVQRALSYKGNVNSDREGNRLFSNGKPQSWCADFVTYNVRQTYGSKLPSDFGSSSVSELQRWGKDKGCYLNTRALSKNERANYIAQNVKPGDIMIEKDGGASHTGIVTKVYSDGSFDTVEGNTSNNKVDTHHHSPNSAALSGFVTLDKFA